MNGGLGNQMFQYIFFRWLQLHCEDECIVDDSAFFGKNVPHSGYEIEKFGLHPQRLSSLFAADIWDFMLKRRQGGNGIAQQLLEAGMELTAVQETGNDNFSFGGKIIKMRDSDQVPIPAGNTYYHGYYLGNKYYWDIHDNIGQEIVFPKLDAVNQALWQHICQCDSVGIHVRRGDMAALGWSADPSFFAKAIAYMETVYKQPEYFLFSDDLAWCQEHREELGLAALGKRVRPVSGNEGDKAYIDLLLLISCKQRIGDRSSFSFLASCLSDNNKGDILKWQNR